MWKIFHEELIWHSYINVVVLVAYILSESYFVYGDF